MSEIRITEGLEFQETFDFRLWRDESESGADEIAEWTCALDLDPDPLYGGRIPQTETMLSWCTQDDWRRERAGREGTEEGKKGRMKGINQSMNG